MKRVPDHKKLRREYLRRKRAAIGEALFSLGGIYGGLIVTILVGAIPYRLFWGTGNLIVFVAGVVMTLICARMTFYQYHEFRRKLTQVREIPYVPPITRSTLPPEEVLVRGAEQPSAANETLLRPAQADEQSEPGELLRSHLR